jgi:hypothetical protein
MKYALVHGARICQLVAAAKDRFPVAPELSWVEVVDDTTERDTFVDGKLVKYEPPIALQSSMIDGADFLARVTDEEYQAIIAATGTSVQIARWVELLRLRGQIDVSGTTAQAAKTGLVAAGLLSQRRANAIFSPPA